MNFGDELELIGFITINPPTRATGSAWWEAVVSREKLSKLTMTSPELVTRLDDKTLLISTLSARSITEKKAVKVSKNILTKDQTYDVTIDKT